MIKHQLVSLYVILMQLRNLKKLNAYLFQHFVIQEDDETGQKVNPPLTLPERPSENDTNVEYLDLEDIVPIVQCRRCKQSSLIK